MTSPSPLKVPLTTRGLIISAAHHSGRLTNGKILSYGGGGGTECPELGGGGRVKLVPCVLTPWIYMVWGGGGGGRKYPVVTLPTVGPTYPD